MLYAQSPLLGADGAKGEWMSLTASNLIKNGVYEKIIIVSSGIGDTSIKRWAKGNDLNRMFIDVISNLSKKYIALLILFFIKAKQIKKHMVMFTSIILKH